MVGFAEDGKVGIDGQMREPKIAERREVVRVTNKDASAFSRVFGRVADDGKTMRIISRYLATNSSGAWRGSCGA